MSALERRSSVGEAYEFVGMNLEFARAGREQLAAIITSALPGEGKSTTAANLALVLADAGKRVILVDADLRDPVLHRLFQLPNSAGLSTLFVTEAVDLDGCLHRTAVDNLCVLTSGPRPPNPAALFTSARMGRIIDSLKSAADIVLFDGASLLGTAAGVALAGQVDGVVIVVDASRTRQDVLAEAVERLEHTNTPLWGVVLNKLAPRHVREFRTYPTGGTEAAEDTVVTEAPASAAGWRKLTGGTGHAPVERRVL
jgi:capsular exopolysaccharide synthesis family protein